MKIVVIGASGRTGRLVIERAVAAGHRVTGVSRRADAVPASQPDLTVSHGDVLIPETLADPLAAADAVFYLVAEPGRSTTVTRSFGMANVVEALRANDRAHVFTVAPSAIDVSPSASWWRRMTVRMVIDKRNRNPFLDHERTEDEMRNGAVDWTAVRVRALVDGPATGAWRSAVGNHITDERPVTRADLADFLVRALVDESVNNQVVTVSGP